jgi:hypothetical protein
MPDTLNSPTVSNLASLCGFNPNYDIVWSFQYSLCGNSNASAGFTTFLFSKKTASTVVGGGIGRALGVGPSTNFTNTTNISGISGHSLSIAFDTTGLYATSGYGFTTNMTPSANSLVIRVDNGVTMPSMSFHLLSAFSLSALYTNFTLLTSIEVYNTLRFTLTNCAQTLKIDILANGEYVNLAEVATYKTIYNSPSARYCIGISYASPVSGNAPKAVFRIKDFHVQGTDKNTDTTSLTSDILTY